MENVEERIITNLDGRLHSYNNNNNALFINNIESKKAIIFINGLGGTLVSPNYLEKLNEMCKKLNIKLLVPQFDSHPAFQLKPIESDLTNLLELLDDQSQNLDEIVLMGHSTGCQVSLLFIEKFMNKKIKGVILQAPVSDVEGMEIDVKDLSEYLNKARNNKYVEFNDQIFLSERFLSLYERNNKEDLFSSWTDDQRLIKIGKITKIISIVSEADKYCYVDVKHKLKLLGEVVTIKEAGHSIKDKEHQSILVDHVKFFLEKLDLI